MALSLDTKTSPEPSDIIMSAMASQITSHTIVYSIVYWGADQRKHQSSASLAFVWGIHRSPVNSPHKWPVMRKMFPFDDIITTFDLSSVRSRQTYNTLHNNPNNIFENHIFFFFIPVSAFSWYQWDQMLALVILIARHFHLLIFVIISWCLEVNISHVVDA